MHSLIHASARSSATRGHTLGSPHVYDTWGELHVGSPSIFAATGFIEANRPSLRRVVMRIDF